MTARHLRTTFDQVAEIYDRARPPYPPQLFDDLVALATLPGAARLVEIGCGTGQATHLCVGSKAKVIDFMGSVGFRAIRTTTR